VFEVKYLGIDIINENSESLLKEPNAEFIQIYLNKNGLCKNVDSIEMIKNILSFDLQKFKWTAYYVYCLRMN
ncbi:MAG: hypothetical protein K2J59_03970, partial [Eubacterium sp.]|nr:hypothetical protein [Eubacterium sp.]